MTTNNWTNTTSSSTGKYTLDNMEYFQSKENERYIFQRYMKETDNIKSSLDEPEKKVEILSFDIKELDI